MTVVACFNLPAYGHINPTLGLVRELASRGDRILYFSTPPFREHLEAAGATFVDYGIQFWERGTEPVEGLRVMNNMVTFAHVLSERLCVQARTLGVQAILHDAYTVWGKKVAQVLGVPAVATYPNYAVDVPFFFRTSLKDLEGVRRVVRGLPAMAKLAARTALLNRRLRIPSMDVLDTMFNPEPLNIVFTSREMQANAERFDGRFEFVGASIERSSPPGDFPLEVLDGRRVVYLSLGTVYNDRPEFYRECAAAFADAPYTVIMAVGADVDPASLGPLPPRVLAYRSVPQLDVLQRSLVFVTQAGSTSVNEALSFGVPMVCMPRAADQHWSAHRIDELGAGLDLGAGRVDAFEVRRAVQRILEQPLYTRRAMALGDGMRRAGGAERAARLVRGYFAARGVV